MGNFVSAHRDEITRNVNGSPWSGNAKGVLHKGSHVKGLSATIQYA